ncbi:MAG: hypothetical protein HQ559_14185 [Lentisphaerae bacterium]|nr:hypothetical protein [Lentisphaerota bacterium]
MTGWFLKIIGVSDGLTSRLDQVQLLWARPMLLLAGLALLVPVGFFIVRRHSISLRHMDRGLRIGLNICRIGVLLLLVVIAGGPYLRIEEPKTSKPVVILLVDESASMDLPAGPFSGDEAEQLAVSCGLVTPTEETADIELDPETRKRLNTMSRAELVRLALGTEWAALVESVGDRLEFQAYAAARTVRRTQADALAQGDRGDDLQDTALGSALEFAIDEAAGRDIAGVVLISDGRNTAGPDPVQVLRRYNGSDIDPASVPVPVWTVPAGSTEPIPDIAVLNVMAPMHVNLGDDTEVTATLFSSGFGGRSVTVTLIEGEQVLDSKEAGLVENTRQQVQLTFKPEDAGPRMLAVHVAPMVEEQVVNNNRAGVFVDVEERRRKVLYLEGIPRWDFRFLDHAMRRDRGLEVTLFLEAERSDPPRTNAENDAVEAILAAKDVSDPKEPSMLVDSAIAANPPEEDEVQEIPASPNTLPEDADGFAEYDAVMIGDVSPAFLTPRHQEQLAAAVTDHGVGLIVQAGTVHMPHDYADGPLAQQLPVVVTRHPVGRTAPAFAPFRMSVTPSGSMHPAFQVYSGASRNREVWGNMPEFYWTAASLEKTAGGTILAEIEHDGEAFPLIAEQTSGRGRVLFVGTDSTFRWRRNIGDSLFYTFWGQAIRHVAHRSGKDSDQSWLDISPRRVEPGDPVAVELFAVRKEGEPVIDEQVTVTITAAGSTEILALDGGSVPGQYRGVWTPREVGAYRVEYTDWRKMPINAFFQAAGSGREQTRPDVDQDMLGSLADSTGCGMLRLHELGELADKLRGDPVDYTHAYEEEIWDNWLFLVLLVGFYCTDVGIRRIRGLM